MDKFNNNNEVEVENGLYDEPIEIDSPEIDSPDGLDYRNINCFTKFKYFIYGIIYDYQQRRRYQRNIKILFKQ